MMKTIRTCNIHPIIYNFKRWFLSNEMILIKSFLTRVFFDHFKPIYVYLNEGNKVLESYSSLRLMMQASLYVGFSTILFVRHFSLKLFY